jgi:hypothetical protein
MSETPTITSLEIRLSVWCHHRGQFGAQASVDTDPVPGYGDGRTPQTAARQAVRDLLARFPSWDATDQELRREINNRLIESLRASGAEKVAGRLALALRPPFKRDLEGRLRVLAARAVSDGANRAQAAAITLLAQLHNADGVTQELTLESLKRLLEHPAITPAHAAQASAP